MVRPFAVRGGLLLDPFAGSGAILLAAEECGMRTIGFELNPLELPQPADAVASPLETATSVPSRIQTPEDEGAK